MTATSTGHHSFHFDDVTVSIMTMDSRFEAALRRLAHDFENFPRGVEMTGGEISVEISSGRPHRSRGLFKTRLTPNYSFFPRICDHGGGTTSKVSRRGDDVTVLIDGEDVDHVYEIAYVAILSLLGWELEKRGYVRLHALTLSFEESAAVFHLPPKGGKSTLALEAIRNGVDVLGDEIALVRGGRCHAFPIRVAVAQKIAGEMESDSRLFKRKTFDDKALVSLPRPRARALPLGKVLFQSRPGLADGASPATFIDALMWIAWICSGRGLPQMREFVFRAEELSWIPVLAWRRLVFAISVLKRGSLVVSREIETVEIGVSVRSRLGWARSSSGTSEPEFAGSPTRLPWDTECEERA